MSIPNRLILVVLLLPRLISKLLELAAHIIQSLTNNPRFANMNPTLAELQTAYDDLERAQNAMKTRTRGTREVRDEKAAALRSILKRVQAVVQGVADANPAEAEAIILSAGMSVKRATVHHRPDFEVKQGKVSGEVVLLVKRAGRRACYEWQYGTDQKSWTNLPTTVLVKTTVRDLTPGTTYSFRFRAVTPAGEGDWSQILTFMVK